MIDLNWPEGAEAKIDDTFSKWVDGAQYDLIGGNWTENLNNWSLDKFKLNGSFTIIERQIDTVEINWPEGAEAKVNDIFTKWIDGVEYYLKEGEWVQSWNSRSLDKYKSNNDFKVIERPIETVEINWPEGSEAKIDEDFAKWVDGVEYNLDHGEWVKNQNSWSLVKFKSSDDFKVIERPIETVEIKEVSKPIDTPYLPEVGEWCDYRTVQKGEYRKAFFIGHNEVGEHVLKDVHGDFIEDSCNFRPIKTECEKFIEKGIEINRSLTIGATETEMFVALFEAGFKAPEY
jgi:hypothetical protein